MMWILGCFSGATKSQNYPFGIMGMVNKADCLQKGELVKFQVCTIVQTGQKMACNVVPQRRALVECVKDQVMICLFSWGLIGSCRIKHTDHAGNYKEEVLKVLVVFFVFFKFVFILNLLPVWLYHVWSWWEQEAVLPCKRSAGRPGAPDWGWGGVLCRPQSTHRKM